MSKNNTTWIPSDREPINFLQEYPIEPVVLEDEVSVGLAMFNELVRVSENKDGDINIVLLGGRGAQALHRHLGELAKGRSIDDLLNRLNVFTQDALAPMRMDNGLSFVRDFERLLGENFFNKIKSFTPMNTESEDLTESISEYLKKMNDLGGIDIFFIGHGPEDKGASHLAYIKPGSGAKKDHIAGIIPISKTILEHHISKFKAGGSYVSDVDEAECRDAEFILTLGPAAILGAKKIVQSVVDADSAPAKKITYRNVLEAKLSTDPEELSNQLDNNPGLWIKLHNNVVSFILPNLLA